MTFPDFGLSQGENTFSPGMWIWSQFPQQQEISQGLFSCWKLALSGKRRVNISEVRHTPVLRVLYSCICFGICTLSCSWLMRWFGMMNFPVGQQLCSCPVWTKKVINLGTNPFRLKMWFQRIFAKCSPIPWEQVQWISPINIYVKSF